MRDEHHNHTDSPEDLEYKARKGIVHAIRFSYYGLQLVMHNRIVDFTEANSLHYEVMAAPTGAPPEYFEKKYKGVMDGKFLQFPSNY